MSHDLPGGRLDRGDPAEACPGGFAADPFGVVAGTDQESSRDVGTDSGSAQQLRSGICDETLDPGVEPGELDVQDPDASC